MKVWTEVNHEDGFTFPANKPNRTLDYILTAHGIQTELSETLNTLVSDHLPLISDVILFR